MADEYLPSFAVKREMFHAFFGNSEESELDMEVDRPEAMLFSHQIEGFVENIITESQGMGPQMTSSTLQLDDSVSSPSKPTQIAVKTMKREEAFKKYVSQQNNRSSDLMMIIVEKNIDEMCIYHILKKDKDAILKVLP